jgi:pimeloyl-ACP methyl ester carboxylesterase
MPLKPFASALVLSFLSCQAIAQQPAAPPPQAAPPQRPAPAPQPPAVQDRLLNVNGRAVHVQTFGRPGAPVVIFETGMGDTLETWSHVIPEISKIAQTVAYDRAGTGQSSAVAGERSYTQIVKELHELLQNLKLPPPYLFVGHGFGAFIARAFYAANPSEVNGIVFVDPLPEKMLLQASREKRPEQVDERFKKAPAGVHSEFDYLNKDMATGFRTLAAFPKPNVPMTLFVARSVRPGGWEQGVLDRYGPWIMERDDSSMTVTANSAQFVQMDEPELIIFAIRRMLYPNPLPALRRTLRDKGLDATFALFREQAARYPKQDFTSDILNSLGYETMSANQIDDAIRIFTLNVETFPKDGNAYDSLGEAYAASGNRELAIANYRKSLEFDPKNLHAGQEIVKLQNKK